MRFRTEQHLRRQTDIRGVREQGRRIECRAFTLWWRRRQLTNPPTTLTVGTVKQNQRPRVCVVASTAAVGNATQRNRAKRLLREVFRHHQERVPRDCDLLLIARGLVLQWPYAELEKKFTEACGHMSSGSRNQE